MARKGRRQRRSPAEAFGISKSQQDLQKGSATPRAPASRGPWISKGYASHRRHEIKEKVALGRRGRFSMPKWSQKGIQNNQTGVNMGSQNKAKERSKPPLRNRVAKSILTGFQKTQTHSPPNTRQRNFYGFPPILKMVCLTQVNTP